MKLHYFPGRGPLKTLVMIREDGRRVELHIKLIGENVWALVTLAGDESDSKADRHRCQGPYHSAGQAEAVLRGIAGALVGEGFVAKPAGQLVWDLDVQRLARAIRLEREANTGQYEFDPDQYEPLT